MNQFDKELDTALSGSEPVSDEDEFGSRFCVRIEIIHPDSSRSVAEAIAAEYAHQYMMDLTVTDCGHNSSVLCSIGPPDSWVSFALRHGRAGPSVYGRRTLGFTSGMVHYVFKILDVYDE